MSGSVLSQAFGEHVVPVALVDATGAYIGGSGGSTAVGRYDLTPPTRSSGDVGPLETDAQGRALTYLSTLLAGEDLPNDVQKVEARYQSKQILTATTTLVATGAGIIGGIQFLGGTAGAITIYDNTTGSGTVIAGPFTPTATVPSPEIGAGIKFTNGLTIVTAAATVLLVKYAQGAR